MTKQEAMDKGFVYEGTVGVVPVYLTELNAFGTKVPGIAAKSPALELVLDAQEALNKAACKAINFFKPGAAEGFPIIFGNRLDGKPVTEKELD